MLKSSSGSKAEFRIGDRVFNTVTTGAAFLLIGSLALVAIFLITQSIPAFNATSETASLLTGNFWGYVLPLIFGTVWVSSIALVIALPIAIGVALFTTHYAPRRLANFFTSIIDLLAAVPSVIFGLWGITILAPAVQPLFAWLTENLGWIPLFAGPVSATGRTVLTAALVLVVMILPIITSLTREVFKHTPKLVEEAAYGLGATKWEMLRMSVLPYSKSGIVSAAMLGLGRALGETMAVTMVLSATGTVTFKLLTSNNPSTIAANIALNFPEAYQTNINVLIATGLILFIVTLLISFLSRLIVRRKAVV